LLRVDVTADDAHASWHDLGVSLVALTLRTLEYSRAPGQLEVLALRHQLEVLQRTKPRRVRLAKMERWLWVMLSRYWTRRPRP